LKKFVKRNKVQVIAASLVLLSLVAGMAGTMLGLLEAKSQEAKALAAADKERNAREEAQRNLAFAKKGNEILGSVFAGLDPHTNYATLGDFSNALTDNLKKAVKELEGSSIGDPLEVAAMQNTLGFSLLGLHEGDLAAEVLQKAQDTMKARLGPDHPNTLHILNNLASAYREVGKLPEAIALFERVRDARIAKLGPDHPDTLTTLDNLAGAYRDVGNLPEAIALFERVRDVEIARLGPDHPDTLVTLNNLALAYRDVGKLPEAIALFERVREGEIAKLGPDHPHTLTTLNNLAAAYWSAKRLDKSVPLFEDSLKRRQAKLGRQHPDTLMTVANLGVNYKDAGRLEEAIPLLEEAHRAAKSFPSLRWVGIQLIDAYAKAGENAKLADLLREQLTDARKEMPKDSPHLAGMLAQIGQILMRQRTKWAEAEPLLRESLAIREKTQPDVWSTFDIQSRLGGALLGQKKYAEAEPLLLKGYEGMKARVKSIPPMGVVRLAEALDRLIELYAATNKPEEVKTWRAERAKYDKDAGANPGDKK
jgi:tetratricopeptide (TPR) repeat protein